MNLLYKSTLARMLTGVCRDLVSPRDIKLIQYVISYRVGSRLERRSTVLDLVVQRRRDTEAALRLLKRLLHNQPVEPETITTDGLASY